VGNGTGGTFVLMANVQDDGGRIFQAGYGRCAGEIDNHFVYVLADGVAHYALNSQGNPIKPYDGSKYRASIYRNMQGKVSIQFTDMTTNTIFWTMNSNYLWSTDLDHAWWGYETIDDESDLGHETGDGQNIDMNVMGYYGSAHTWWYRSGLGSAYCAGEGCSSWAHIQFKTTTYTSDTFDVYSDSPH
jgi:hypothetical protein